MSVLAPAIRQAVLERKLTGTLDIHTLLLCPDPSRRVSRSYKTLEALGRGGFGVVFRVHHLPSGEERAIKVISKPSEEAAVKRLLAEVHALITLDHPNIMKLYEYFEDQQVLCLVMELCTGGHLGELDTAVTEDKEIRALYHDVVAAVAYCHSEGVAHRDLKFENCLLSDRDSMRSRRVAKVIDFGLAAIRKRGDTTKHWMSEAVGTIYFVAPEVLNCTDDTWQSYGMKCDMWSLGVMLYITLTDQHPFARSAASRQAIVERTRRCQMRFDPLNDAGVDPVARDLLGKLLVKDPAQRLSAADALTHPWFDPDSPGSRSSTLYRFTKRSIRPTLRPSKTMMRQMIDRVVSFSSFTRFEQALLTLVAHEASCREVEDLRAAFALLDQKRAGWLTRLDFRSAIEAQGVQISEEEIGAVFRSLDPDNDDKIQYTDWIAATLKPSAIRTDKAMTELFHFFDIHGEGKVSRSDLCEVMGEDVAAAVLDKANASSDGTLEWNDFRCLMIDIARHLELAHCPEPL